MDHVNRLDTAPLFAPRDYEAPSLFTPQNLLREARRQNGMLQALEDAYQQVQKVNDLQRQFLLDVSHELRTPLTVMLSSLDLIRKVGATDPEFQASSLQRVRAEADRMARMVTQLLILVRSDAQVTAAYEPVLLRDLLADLCSQRHATEREPALECRELEGLEGMLVWGNPDYLKQLFLILLDNACKYTHADGRVTLMGSLEGGTVTVTVADTGMGIPPGDLPSIFERFYRAENARSQPGASLGLAIAHRIAEQHGGKIEVESALGQGSRFLVTLPCL
jgi:signal transduction histidine kinase